MKHKVLPLESREEEELRLPAFRLSSCRGNASARRGCATLKPKYLRDRASSGRHLGGFESPYTAQGAGASGRQEKARKRGTSLGTPAVTRVFREYQHRTGPPI